MIALPHQGLRGLRIHVGHALLLAHKVPLQLRVILVKTTHKGGLEIEQSRGRETMRR